MKPIQWDRRATSIARGAVTVAIAAALLAAAGCSENEYHFGSGTSWPWVVDGNRKVVEEVRPATGFTRIDLRGVGNLDVAQGSGETLLVRGEENLLSHVRTEVRSGTLVIWKDEATLRHTSPIEYHVTAVNLEELALTGAGSIRADGLTVGSLSLRLPGVGDADLTSLAADELFVEASGVGDVTASGTATEQTVRLSGLGGYDGHALTTAVTTVEIDQGGSATVNVTDRLVVLIRGSGNVYYLGDPVIESTITGSGRVVRIDGVTVTAGR